MLYCVYLYPWEENELLRDQIKKSMHWGVTIFLVVAASILLHSMLNNLEKIGDVLGTVLSVLTPISYGLVIAFLLNPLMQRIEALLLKIPVKSKRAETRRKKLARALAILGSVLFLLAILAFLLIILLPQLINSIGLLVGNIGDYATALESWLTPFLAESGEEVRVFVDSSIERLRDWISSLLQDDFITLLSGITTGVVQVGRTVYHFIMGVIVSVYLLASKERLIAICKKCIYALLKPANGNKLLGVMREANQLFRAFLVGKLLDSGTIGILCFIGTSILKMPYSLLISAVICMTDLIPYFGPVIGAVPCALIILMIDPMKCVIFVIFILCLQQIEGNIISPRIVGGKTGVSPFGVLLSILVGGGLFGFVGMLAAVPTFGLIYRICKRFIEKKLANRKLPLETQTYTSLGSVQSDVNGEPVIEPLETPQANKRSS